MELNFPLPYWYQTALVSLVAGALMCFVLVALNEYSDKFESKVLKVIHVAALLCFVAFAGFGGLFLCVQ